VAATDITKGQVHYFIEGELIPAVVSSSSIPGVFSPTYFNGGTYVDGGLVDNLPVKPIKDKCDFVVGLHCNPISSGFDARNLKIVIERSMLLAINVNTQISRSMCDLFIEPPHLDKFSSFDIARAQEIFDAGYKFTKENFMPHNFQREKVA
jgi:NTE family protein